MGKNEFAAGSALSATQQPAIRFLVESALRKVSSTRGDRAPRTRDEWVTHLVEALMSESETSHNAVIASLMATGVTHQELFDYFIPAASRHLGELWVQDRASFVDVTVGAGRLQALFRDCLGADADRFDRSIPLGQSLLMVVPTFENHSLGAFVAADQLRRHGVWVHMAIGMASNEVAELIARRRFSAVGITAATSNTLENVADFVNDMRTKLDRVPPVVVGGRAVVDSELVVARTGADFAVKSAREAVERCGLSSVSPPLTIDSLG